MPVTPETTQKRLAVLEVLLASALWSIAGVLMKLLPWSGMVIAGGRCLFAGSVALLYMLARRQKLTVNRHSLFGAAALALTFICFSIANKATTAANAIVLQFTSPIWVMLLSTLFLRKRFRRADVLAAVFTLGGIVLFFADSVGAGNLIGNLVALGSGLTFGCYYISLGEGPENERMSAIVLAHAMTLLCSIPFWLTEQPGITGQTAVVIAVLGVVQLGIPYVLLGHGSSHCPPLACCLLGALEPLLNPVWVAVFDGEMPGLLAILGGIAVIAAVSVWMVWDARHPNPEQGGQEP